MCKFADMQTELLTFKICSWKFFFSTGIPRESKVHNCNRYGHLILWGSVGHLGRRNCLVLSLFCLLSRVLKTVFVGLEHVLCGTENTVRLPKLAGLQYKQVPPSRNRWLVHRNMQRKDRQGVLWLFQKLLLCLFKLSYTDCEAEAQLFNSDSWSCSLLCDGLSRGYNLYDNMTLLKA